MRKLLPFVLLFSAMLAAQTPPPGSIKLLPQYEHLPASGKNADKAGTIQRANGPRIEYEFGISAPQTDVPQSTYAPSPHGAEADVTKPHMPSTYDIDLVPGPSSIIEENTSIAGRPVRFIGLHLKRGHQADVYFTRDKLRFRSLYANSQQLAEILLTALSYPARPDQPTFMRIPFRRIKLEKDPANAIITHGRVTHTVGENSSGTLTQPNEPQIAYTVGTPAKALAEWSLQQDFIGHPISVSYGRIAADPVPRLQIVFTPQPGADADPVTFIAPVKDDREFVHVLMTVLTYHQ
ncbi:MAG TPA: hypothetical protein VMZ25_11970 [Terriglobales bacterium]|nr:hypothetical protein [Terriglobales bacterium]